MIGLVTAINGVAFLLFHMEQKKGEVWLYRWRMRGDLPSSYLRWRDGSTSSALEIVQPEKAGVLVEAEWWEVKTATWRQATLLQLKRGTARFRVRAREDFHEANGFVAVAPMEGLGLASYRFPATSLSAGREIEMNGRPEGLCPANLLLEPGCFRPVDPRLEIENVGVLLDGWEVASGEAVLSAQPILRERYFAFAGGKVEIPETPADP